MPNASPSMGARFAMALLRAAVVFAAAVACALLLPATYQTTALLHADPAVPGTPARLLEVALDRALLERLAVERAGSTEASAVARAAGELADTVRLEARDSRTLALTVSDPHADRARRHCNEIARRLVQRAGTLQHSEADQSRDPPRENAALELVRFVAGHPQLWNESKAPSGEPTGESRRRIVNLLSERALIQQKLAEVSAPRAPNSDNPYDTVGPAELDKDRLTRRLAEIDASLVAERRNAERAPALTATDPQITERLRSLLDGLGSSPPAVVAASPAAVALSLVREAPRPNWPNQAAGTFVLILGGLAAIGVFLFPELRREALLRQKGAAASELVNPPLSAHPSRKRHSSAPPPRSTPPTEPAMQVAPTLPAGPATRSTVARSDPGHSLRASEVPGDATSEPPLRSPSPEAAPLPVAPSAPAVDSPKATPATDAPSFPAASPAPSSAPEPAPTEGEAAQPSTGEDADAELPLVMAYPAERWIAPPTSSRCQTLCLDLLELAQDTSLIVTVSSAAGSAALRDRVAIELALGLSETPDRRVLLVEADFGRPSGPPLLSVGALTAKPFSEQLRSREAGVPAQQWFVTACSPSLHALLDVGGAAADLVSSKPFKAAITELQEYYDFVVIAGPPLERAKECRAADAVSDTIIVAHGENQPLDPRGWPFSKRLMLISLRA